MRKFFTNEVMCILLTALSAVLLSSHPARAQEVQSPPAPPLLTTSEKAKDALPQGTCAAEIKLHQATMELSPAGAQCFKFTTADSETHVGLDPSKLRRAAFDFTVRRENFDRIRLTRALQDDGKTGDPDSLSGNGSRSANGSQNNSPIPLLTAGQKFRYGLRKAFFSPDAYIGPGVGAALRRTQELKVPAKTGEDEFADYLSAYARDFGTSSTTELFASGIYPALFKQNPIYTPLKKISQGRAGRRARLLYALGGAVVTPGDDGKRQPNYSRFAGNFTGAALANIWERDTPKKRNEFGVVTDVNRRRGVGQTFQRFGFSLGFDALSNVLEEFFGFGR